jgi:hypothetical protein
MDFATWPGCSGLSAATNHLSLINRYLTKLFDAFFPVFEQVPFVSSGLLIDAALKWHYKKTGKSCK